jgi:hypothetical protein
MARSGRTPEGYYSAAQAMRKLNISSSKLYHFVETGKIRRIVQPDMREGYYLQEDVDTMAREREMFLQTFYEGQVFMSTQEAKAPTLPEQDTNTIFERLDRIEKQLDEQKILLAEILARLPQNP